MKRSYAGIVVTALIGAIGITAVNDWLTQPDTTITVSIYHGNHGTSGFEGVTTCHSSQTSDHGKLVKYHGCSPIHH